MTRKRKASTSQQDNEVVVKRENEQQIVGQSHHQIVGQSPSGPSPGASLSQPSPSTAPPQPSPPQSQTPRFEFDSELEFDGVYEQHQHANLHNDDPNDDPNSPFRPGDEIVEFGQFHAKVVGVRYYSGQVGVGEQTLLKREPLNKYDKNAIAVTSIHGTQIGHIPRDIASALAPLMDKNLVTVGGICKGGKGAYTMPINLVFYGKARDRDAISPILSRSLGAQKPLAVKQKESISKLTKGFSFTQRENNVSDIDSLLNVKDLAVLKPYQELSKDLIVSDLLFHQRQALQWLADQENLTLPATSADTPVQFWKKTKNGYQHIATNSLFDKPELCKGGILADDMGLGKTLSILSLISLDTLNERDSTEDYYSTLVVAPLSVLENWVGQIQEHVAPDLLPAYVYHGSTRSKKLAFLKTHRIILTTYGTLASEFKSATSKKNGPLFKFKWNRVVLDEGHLIKNPDTKSAQSCYQLESKSRFICSGTPIINELKDLFSLLKFLRVTPFDDFDWFKMIIKRPIDQQMESGFRNLQLLVQQLVLRRTKAMEINGKPIIQLLPCKVYIHSIDFTPEHREKYDMLESACIQHLRTLISINMLGKAYSFVLVMLTRLRQFCDCPSLIPEDYLDILRDTDPLDINYSSKNVQEIVAKLREAVENGDECCICLNVLSDPCVTACLHAFDRECIEKCLDTSDSCPLCRTTISAAKLISLPPPTVVEVSKQEGMDESAVPLEEKASPKIQTLIRFVKAIPEGEKTIVFSQWITMLNKVAQFFQVEGIKYFRFDGGMNVKQRDQSLRDFKAYPGSCCLLISLKCGSLGLNITEANQLFLLDPWWNSQVESQAIDRCFRIGQKRAVNVFRFVMKNSVEDRVLKIQRRKDALIRSAFQGIKDANKKASKEGRVSEILELFGL